MTIHKLREAEGLVKRLLPLARNGRYVTQEPAVSMPSATDTRPSRRAMSSADLVHQARAFGEGQQLPDVEDAEAWHARLKEPRT